MESDKDLTNSWDNLLLPRFHNVPIGAAKKLGKIMVAECQEGKLSENLRVL
jgi:hypothetical protein